MRKVKFILFVFPSILFFLYGFGAVLTSDPVKPFEEKDLLLKVSQSDLNKLLDENKVDFENESNIDFVLLLPRDYDGPSKIKINNHSSFKNKYKFTSGNPDDSFALLYLKRTRDGSFNVLRIGDQNDIESIFIFDGVKKVSVNQEVERALDLVTLLNATQSNALAMAYGGSINCLYLDGVIKTKGEISEDDAKLLSFEKIKGGFEVVTEATMHYTKTIDVDASGHLLGSGADPFPEHQMRHEKVKVE